MKQPTRGVTLIEMLVAMSVASVVMVAIVGIFTTILRQWSTQISRSSALQTANLGIDLMAKEIRNAVVYNATDSSKTSTFTLPANTDASGNYVPAWSGGTLAYQSGPRVHFYLASATGSGTGTILWREYNPNATGNAGWVPDTAWSRSQGSTTRGKMSGLTALSFTTTGLPSDTVRLSVTVSATEGSQTSTYTIQRDVYLSNHN